MLIHSDGRFYGWRAIVKYARISSYNRKKKVKADIGGRGCAGALRSLLLTEPDFDQRFTRWILKFPTQGELGEVKKPIQRIWRWFLQELEKLGYKIRNEWPFTTQSMGYQAVRSYVKRVMESNPRRAAQLVGGKPLADKMKVGDGVDRPVRRAYQRVEMDAHKLNGRFCILVPHPIGGHAPIIVRRLWVIVIIDVYTRAVLGYHLSRGAEVNKQDVLLAIKSALTRWQPMTLSMGGVRYMDEAALPSGHQERYEGLCWDETSVDGALAGKCEDVMQSLRTVVGSTMIEPTSGWSQRRLKDDRPFVETFFRTLGQRGLNRASNSTGSKPSEKAGRDPELVALNSQFQLEYLEELLDVLIANYNTTEHAGLGHRSPLQFLDFLTTRVGASEIRRADPQLMNALLNVRKICTVKGGYRTGRRPYVNFYGAAYSGEILAGRHDLVGRKIVVTNHLHDDARVVKASTADGFSLGVLRAAAPWHGLPHSLSVRSAIQVLVNARKFRIASGGDAVASFIEFVESSQGKKLPPHPAYLSLRKILVDVAHRANDGDADTGVELARARLAERREVLAEAESVDVDDAESARKLSRVPTRSSAIERSSSTPRPPTKPIKKMPLPRMAANR